MTIIFYKLRNEEKIKVLSPLFINIKKNKIFKTKYETASLKFHLFNEGEAIYQINKDLEILGFIGYDFSKFNNTTFKIFNDNTTLYFENCNMPKHLKIKKGMTVIKNPLFNKKDSIIEFNHLHEGFLKFYHNNTNIEIITDDIYKLTIVGSLENGLINGKFYQIPTIENLNLIETNIKLGSLKSNQTKIENSDIDILYPLRTSLGKKVKIFDSKIKTNQQTLDLTGNLKDEVYYYLDNVLLESPFKIKLPRGYYSLNKYPTRTLYKNQNNKAIYTDLDINRQDYIIKLKELKSKYTSQKDSKVYVKRK